MTDALAAGSVKKGLLHHYITFNGIVRNSFERLNVRIILQTGLTFVVNGVVALVLAKTTGPRSNGPPVTAFSRLPR